MIADARVLVVSVELSTVHLNVETTIEPLLAMLLFGDGAAAALIGAEERGFAMEEPFAAATQNVIPRLQHQQ